MASDYEREPLFRYFPAYTKFNLRDERPHKIKWKDQHGSEMETLIYIDDGTHDVEFAVVENRERFDEAVEGQRWKTRSCSLCSRVFLGASPGRIGSL